MLKVIFIFLISLMAAGQAYPLSLSKPDKPKTVIHHLLKVDSSSVNIRQFDTTAIVKYHKDPSFNYAEKSAALTWWDRFWTWVWVLWSNFWGWVASILQRLFGSVRAGKNAASIFKYVIIGLAAIMIVYVIFKLIGIDLLRIFKKNKAIVEVPYSESIENIHEINFDDAVENALLVKDYRLAVRLLYLRSLKQLSDSNLINWKLGKTNSTYLSEIADAEQRRQFSIVTRQFEYVWYGDFPVDGQSFQNINAIFQEFKKRLS